VENGFTVKIRDVEGPLDLILSLIEERKLLISDISLSQVADDFLAYIQTASAFPLGQAAHFVLVAATLLLLKSRSLLPVLSLTSDEEGDIRDLEWRLKILQVFKGIAKTFGGFNQHMSFGGGAKITDPLFSPSPDLSLSSLKDAISRVLENAPKPNLRPEVSVQKVISLEEMISRLAERIEKAIQLTFRDFSGGKSVDRRELVVGFLAMLELVKRGLVLVNQESSFGDIIMDYQGEARTPRFE
jgi:segregation and condensation protein A